MSCILTPKNNYLYSLAYIILVRVLKVKKCVILLFYLPLYLVVKKNLTTSERCAYFFIELGGGGGHDAFPLSGMPQTRCLRRQFAEPRHAVWSTVS